MCFPLFKSLCTAIPLSGIVGCTTTQTQQRLPSPSQSGTTSADSSLIKNAPNVLALADILRTGRAHYQYTTFSVVQVITGDSIPRADSITVNALVTLDLANQDRQRTQAIITSDSITVRVASLLTRVIPPTVDTITVNSATGRIVRLSASSALCRAEEQNATIRNDDVIPQLPLRAGSLTWSDTLDRPICRSGLSLQSRRVNNYQLDSTVTPLRITRTTVTTFSGEGLQWNQPVQVSGRSTTTDTLNLDPTIRRLRELRGNTELQLTFHSQFRTQQFRQITQTTVQIR
jgi:hypothetical protein